MDVFNKKYNEKYQKTNVTHETHKKAIEIALKTGKRLYAVFDDAINYYYNNYFKKGETI